MFPTQTCFLSPKDEKDENDRMRQMRGNAVVMHICAHESFSVRQCVCVAHMKGCLNVYISVSPCAYFDVLIISVYI